MYNKLYANTTLSNRGFYFYLFLSKYSISNIETEYVAVRESRSSEVPHFNDDVNVYIYIYTHTLHTIFFFKKVLIYIYIKLTLSSCEVVHPFCFLFSSKFFNLVIGSWNNNIYLKFRNLYRSFSKMHDYSFFFWAVT
jgi:hypothetical protein